MNERMDLRRELLITISPGRLAYQPAVVDKKSGSKIIMSHIGNLSNQATCYYYITMRL